MRWLAIMAMVVGLAGTTARAQSVPKPKCAEAENKGTGTNYEIVRGPDGKKIFKIKTGFCIEGKVPKPSVIYVLNASTINYEWENLKQDFLPKSLKSVESSPF